MSITSKPELPKDPERRSWSPLDKICDQYMLDLSRMDPFSATDWGLPGDQGGVPDLSPEGLQAVYQLNQGVLDALDTTELLDDTDRVTAAALRDRLGLDCELFVTGEHFAELNNIASPLQMLRDIFSLMPTETSEDWENIGRRMAGLPFALDGYRQSLELGASRGLVAAQRQVRLGIEQAVKLSDPKGFFGELIGRCQPELAKEVDQETLSRSAADASRAYGELAQWLEQSLLAQAPEVDRVGRERYERFSALFVGARVDLDETYQWGIEELARIETAQHEIAVALYGAGTSVRECFDRLENDPQRQLHGKPALHKWLQETADMAIRELNGTQFQIPEPLRTIECMIAPTDEGGIWYTAPSSDFSRPGRMWWSVPAGDDTFHTWQERTTVFHEGVPGHHLQLGQAIYQEDSLNLWRRLGSWNSGYGEGWALYAEQLMADLGYQDDPADMLGMLDAQRLRAARVVLDIGVHLGKKRLDGNGIWDADYAWQFLRSNVTGSDAMLRFELDRYLGWPGQAPSYKIGQRLWQQLASDYASSRPGQADAAKQFHTDALGLGSLPMSTLRLAVLGQE